VGGDAARSPRPNACMPRNRWAGCAATLEAACTQLGSCAAASSSAGCSHTPLLARLTSTDAARGRTVSAPSAAPAARGRCPACCAPARSSSSATAPSGSGGGPGRRAESISRGSPFNPWASMCSICGGARIKGPELVAPTAQGSAGGVGGTAQHAAATAAPPPPASPPPCPHSPEGMRPCRPPAAQSPRRRRHPGLTAGPAAWLAARLRCSAAPPPAPRQQPPARRPAVACLQSGCGRCRAPPRPQTNRSGRSTGRERSVRRRPVRHRAARLARCHVAAATGGCSAAAPSCREMRAPLLLEGTAPPPQQRAANGRGCEP
jgi:hypothetical protein